MSRKIVKILICTLCCTILVGASSGTARAEENNLLGITEALSRIYLDMDDDSLVVVEEDASLESIAMLFNINSTSLMAIANVSGYVNIRSGPSLNSDIVGRLYRAAVATVIEEGTEWTRIVSNGIEGYVKADYLLYRDAAITFANEYYSNYIKVNSSMLNIRSGAGLGYSILCTVGIGASLKVVETSGDWTKVTYQGTAFSVTGYVFTEYTTKGYTYAVTQEVVDKNEALAKSQLCNIIWPLPSDHNIYSYFGYRTAPTAGASTYHKGLDIGGTQGSSIVAVLSGTVSYIGYDSSSGNYVEIDHGNGLKTKYLHCSKICVKLGAAVTQGDVVALVGMTGVATGPHLHFSMVKNGTFIDPYQYLKYVK